MKIDDLETLAKLLEDKRSPCERDGHNYAMVESAEGPAMYCSKCGDIKAAPTPPKAGFRKE